MNNESETSQHEMRAPMNGGVADGRPGPSVRQWREAAGFLRRTRALECILITASCAACATSNYDFEALSEVSDHSRAARLSEDLALEMDEGGDRELYDLDVIPLTRTHLKVFAESGGEGTPDGFVETEIAAYLPLFGFVDATVDRYDSDRKRYEHHEFNSYLWGMFLTHRDQVDTRVGTREQKTRRLLWIFDWTSSPAYGDPNDHD